MKLLFFTGSRSEWGYIRPLLKLCKKKKFFIKYAVLICIYLKDLVHQYEITKDGFKVNDQIYMALDGYNKFTMSKSLGILMSFYRRNSKSKARLACILAGDRGETLAASIVGAYTNTPVAHILLEKYLGI